MSIRSSLLRYCFPLTEVDWGNMGCSVVHREGADGGKLAVQVEDKSVRIQNVKVSVSVHRHPNIPPNDPCVGEGFTGLGELGLACTATGCLQLFDQPFPA